MSLQLSLPAMKLTATCPECGGEMAISAVVPTMCSNVVEDITYRCRKCGVTQTREVNTCWFA